MADLQRSHGKYIYHATDVHVVEAKGCCLEAAREGASQTTLWSVPCRRSGLRPGASGGAATLLSSATWKSCASRGFGSSAERTESFWLMPSPPTKTTSAGIIRRFWQRSARTAGCVSCGTSGQRPWKPMGESAAAAGSADAAASTAPAEGAEVEDADTEESSSDSELPDTTAPAVVKAEERSGAAVAAPQERSAADVDMAADMTEAAVANPSLTVGELVDKTTDKLEFMAGYMEGASPMVQFEGARSGAPSSGSAALDRDAGGIDALDDAMEGPSKKEESSSEELVPDDPGRAHRSASKVPRQAATHMAPPAATMAAFTDEAPVVPDAEADGTYACPHCHKSADSVVRAHRRATGPLPQAAFRPYEFHHRQDFRGVCFAFRGGDFFEMRKPQAPIGPDVCPPPGKGARSGSKTEPLLRRVSTRGESESMFRPRRRADSPTAAPSGSHRVEMRDDLTSRRSAAPQRA